MSSFMKFSGTIIKNLFSKPATSNYPAVPKEYPERTRGHVEIDIDDCIMCGMCSRKCPPGAITVDRATGEWTINPFDCIQCGYCVECCPKKCLKIVPGYTNPDEAKEIKKYVNENAKAPKPAANSSNSTNNAAGSEGNANAFSEDAVPVADLEKCVYCTLCAKKCPAGALVVDRNEKVWKLDEEKCVHCGLCATNCPKKCIEMK